MLFLARLVTDGGPDAHLPPTRENTPPGADQDPQARLLEDADIVVVCVPHGPPTAVALAFLTGHRKNVATVAICPFMPRIKTFGDLE